MELLQFLGESFESLGAYASLVTSSGACRWLKAVGRGMAPRCSLSAVVLSDQAQRACALRRHTQYQST